MTMKLTRSRNVLSFSLLGLILLAIIVVAMVATFTTKNAVAEVAEARKSFANDLHAGNLSTPEAFESRCRMADSSRLTDSGMELHYDTVEVYVTFTRSGPPVLESEWADSDSDGKIRTHRIPASPILVFDLLGCK
jgi:hypothetical protein